MRHEKGFTLVQLFVVVLVLMVAGVLLVVVLRSLRTGGHGPGAHCLGNLNSISKGLILYQQSNDNQFPMLPGNNWDTTAQGTNHLPLGAQGRPVPPYGSAGNADWQSSRSVTSLMFLLVRDGQGVKVFICGGDRNVTPDPTPQTSVTSGGVTSMQFNWDFSPGARHVSYSFQCPLYRSSAAGPDVGIENPDPDLVIASDRAPGKASDMNYMSGWNSSVTGKGVNAFSSQSHFNEGMNVLYAGGNVARVKTPNCGVPVGQGGPADCIFTAKDNTGNSDKSLRECGAAFGGVQDIKQHKGKNDSYLAGGRD